MKKHISILGLIGLCSLSSIGQTIENTENPAHNINLTGCYTCSDNFLDPIFKASAFNYKTTASNYYAFVAGDNAIAKGIASTAFGSYTIAGGDYTFAVGKNSQANGNYSMALGYNALATGQYSVSIGLNTVANQDHSFAFGLSSSANRQAFAMGVNAYAIGEQSMVFGNNIKATVLGAFVIGRSIIGNELINTKSNSLMIGFNSTVPSIFVECADNFTKPGNVGIGTADPETLLQILGDTKIGNDLIEPSLIVTSLKSHSGKGAVLADEEGRLLLMDDLTYFGDNLGNHVANQNLNLQNYSIYNGSTPTDASNVGLRFTQENKAILSNGLESSFTINSGAANRSCLWLTNNMTGGFGFLMNSDNLSAGIFYDQYDPKPIINFTSTKVGIGVEPISASNYTLFVKGGIQTEEVMVKLLSKWSDYVFNDDYQLLAIDKVEDFIIQNHHLPDVPSAEEVNKNGINLGEMDAILLKKIEELTLYIIALENRCNQLENSIHSEN